MMKLLFENWKRYLNEDGRTIFYHSTPPWQADVIEANGLKTNSKGIGFTVAGNWADEIYGMRPIYLSAEPGKGGGREYEGATLEVDVTGLELYPDLPTLVDYGANLEEDGSGMWWDYDEVPSEMQVSYANGAPILDPDGYIEYDMLLWPGDAAAKAAINLTDTVAVLQDIPPDRIKRIS